MEIQVPSSPMRRTACYARVSTADQSSGLEAQLRALRIYCEQNGITDVEYFADENQSGTKASRPALDRMMAAVERGEIESVVVFAFSRFARSVSHMLKGLEVLKRHKCNFVSLTEKIDLNTSLGHAVFMILSAIAQLERDLIAERVRNGLANARAKGIRIGRAKTRPSELIRAMLQSGMTLRATAMACKCSHGSVSLERSLMRKEEEAQRAAEKAKQEAEAQSKLAVLDESMPWSN